MMNDFESDELVVLGCELGVRPAGAPGLDKVLAFVTSIRPETGALVIEFDRPGQTTVEAFVAAERLCCSDIGWEIQDSGRLALRITAEQAQLAVLAGAFADTSPR